MKTTALLKRVDLQLAACTVAAGASLTGVHSAEATIIYSGPVNILVPVSTAGLYLNVVTGQSGASPGAAPGWDVNPYGSSALNWFAATPSSTSGYVINAPGGSSPTLVDNLMLGTLIGPANTFGFSNGSESTGPTAFHFNSSNNYVAFGS